MKLLIATAALLIGSSAASAASTNDPSSSRGKSTTARPTIYCFDLEGTGSRILTRVCKTKAEWYVEGIEVPRK